MRVRCPGGITLLVVLGWIQGLLALGAGLFLILDKNSEELQDKAEMSADQLVSTGVGLLVAGSAILILTSMLGRGNSVVRWLFGLLILLNVGIGIWGLFGPEQTGRWFDQN